MKKAGIKNELSLQLKTLLDAVNTNRNAGYSNLEYSIKEAKRSIKYHKDQQVVYATRLKESQENLKKIEINNLKTEDLLKSLEQLKKHKKIQWAFVTNDRRLIVQTKPLTQFDPFLGKDTKEPVGRYAFNINLTHISFSIAAIDFVSQQYRHPNIMYHPGDACWGGFDSDIRKMFKNGDFYAAVDAMILFFSTFPQEGGHRPLYWYVWLAHREHRFYQNPWMEKSKSSIYKIGKIVEPKERRYKITLQDTVVIDKTEYTLKDKSFRSY